MEVWFKLKISGMYFITDKLTAIAIPDRDVLRKYILMRMVTYHKWRLPVVD
jgi:hypothetical protein